MRDGSGGGGDIEGGVGGDSLSVGASAVDQLTDSVSESAGSDSMAKSKLKKKSSKV